jgi:hypothetical protein
MLSHRAATTEMLDSNTSERFLCNGTSHQFGDVVNKSELVEQVANATVTFASTSHAPRVSDGVKFLQSAKSAKSTKKR